jgi:hypothetical protein
VDGLLNHGLQLADIDVYLTIPFHNPWIVGRILWMIELARCRVSILHDTKPLLLILLSGVVSVSETHTPYHDVKISATKRDHRSF